MKKRIGWMLAAALVATPVLPVSAAPSAPQGAAPAQGQGLERIAADKARLLTEQYGTVSVQYALIDEGSIVVSGQNGKNDEQGKIPLAADTMYGIGSVSKMFAAAAVMKLVDEGKIDLDVPLVQYMPDFTMKDERHKQITPRMLLNHSSGLPGSSLNNVFLFEDPDSYAHDTLLQQLAEQSLKADPGAFSVYCNDGFTLAELLVERVSGMAFTAFVHQHFTDPLGMEHTKTPADGVDPARMAGLYFPAMARQLPNETVNIFGAGGIYSTAEDLARFSQLFTDEEQGILSAEAAEAMEQPEYKRGLWPEEADNSIDYGLGWDSIRLYPFGDYGIQALTKGGDTMFYHASLVVLPEQDMAAAVLSSGGSSSTAQLLANQILLEALKEKGEIPDIKPDKSFGKPAPAPLPAGMKKLAGYYGMSGQLAKVELKGDGMSVTLPNAPEYPAEKYMYTADGTFMDEAGTVKIELVKETNGQTYVWVRQYISVPGLGQTALSHYTMQKLASNPLPRETASAWAKREGKTYYPLNEKYTSMLYLLNPKQDIRRVVEFGGYANDKQITGPNSAASRLQIPAMGGRDLAAYRFYRQAGAEYLESAGIRYISEDAVKPLHPGKQSAVTVQQDGHARWFTIPAAAAGKTMTVKLPAAGGFTVYDAAGLPAGSSVAGGTTSVALPAGGTVVFAGEPGSAFGITLSKK